MRSLAGHPVRCRLECAVDLAFQEPRELAKVERLGHESRGPAVCARELALADVVRARENDPYSRMAITHQAGELDAVDAGKHEVDDGQIEGLSPQELECLEGARSGLDLKTLDTQPDRHDARVVRLLFDHKHTRQSAPILLAAQDFQDFGMEPGMPMGYPLRA
jgi:hypothetical protein